MSPTINTLVRTLSLQEQGSTTIQSGKISKLLLQGNLTGRTLTMVFIPSVHSPIIMELVDSQE